jgi:ribonuclease T1
MHIIRHFLIVAAVVASVVAALVPTTLVAGDAPVSAAAIPEIALIALPPEARKTLELIKKGGPYPYARDGVVFGNYERLLPVRKRGYYREYTVPTPGARNRGARRIVAGGIDEYYYTSDHYRSFRRIRE